MNSATFPLFQPNSACNLCNAKLPGPSQAESHYTSLRHMDNLLMYQKELNKSEFGSSMYQRLASGATMDVFDIPTCFRKPVKSSDEDFEIFDCGLCQVVLPTKEEQSKHIKKFPHRFLSIMKTNLLDQGIDKEFYSLSKTKKSINCTLCKTHMNTDQEGKLHLNGNEHLEKFNTWIRDQQMQIAHKRSVNSLELKNYRGSLNSINIDKTNTENEHQSDCRPKSDSSDLLDETITCYICRTSFVKSKKKEHVQNFPHVILAIVRTQLIKLGINKSFCFYSDIKNAIMCTLCNVKVSDPKIANAHLNGKRHMRNFKSWCAQQPVKDLRSQSASKMYYCGVCNIDLDGTSDAEKHYKAKCHLKRDAEIEAEKQTKTKPNFNNLKLEGFMANLTQGNVIQNNLNLKETAKVKPPEYFLKTQIFNEIEKLIEMLYFSKKLPYEVSLQHLKKINSDVEDIIMKQMQKERVQSSCNLSWDNSVSSEVKNSTMENEFFLVEPKKQSFVIVNNSEETPLDERQPEGIIDNPKTPPKMEEKSADKFVSSEVNNSTVKEFVLIEAQDQNFKTANNSEETPLDQEQPKILKIVEIERARIEQHTPTLEVEILDEVDELLRQIDVAKAPFEEILKYLKTFNEVLEDLSVLEEEIICG